ncbi:hypothetical protein RhiTH_010006 [Rhizoctonia solani]
MTFIPLKHVVFVPGPSWALFVYHTEVSKANKYLDTQPPLYSQRIRIVTFSAEESGPPVIIDNAIEMLDHLEACFNLWINSELRQATVFHIGDKPIGAPSLVIEDLANGGVTLGCKKAHGIPITGWWLMPVSSLIMVTGHEETGIRTVYEALAQLDASKETDFLTKANEVYLQNISDRLITMPGIPAIYDWELDPQYLPYIPPFFAYLVPRMITMLESVNTLACGIAFEMEPICAASLSTAFGRPIAPFFIGPAVDLTPPQQLDPDSPVTQFLDRSFAEKGVHSVIYVAFGTTFFPLPSSVSHLMAALDEVPKAGFRFVFALSSESAGVDQEWMDGHIEAGNAIFPRWANQTAVLEHPAIHYFLSHGGWNSSTEALVRGVPMIFWPFMGDQATNALQIANVHDCGFELLQVRTGPAKSKSYQNGADVEIIGTDDAVREEMRRILDLRLPTISGIFLHTYNGTSPLKHVVFLSAPAWSHLRPALKTALRTVEKFPDLFISLFVYHSELSNANKYLSNQQSVCSRRIKIVTGSSVKTAPTLATSNPMEMLDFLELSFKLWITSELQLGSVIQVDGRPVDAPSVIMEDVFNGGMSLSCKNEHNLPIVGWWLATSASLMTKAADVLVQLNKINFISTTFDWVLNISSQLLQNASDRLINIPGLPPHREWELNPQYFPFMPLFMAYLVPRVTRIINEVDAIACCTTLEMEPVCAASLSSSFEYPIESFFIGPAVDLASPNHENDSESLVTQFLNRAYAEKGAHSVIYIAFGTVFFPSSGSIPHLMAILDEIPKAGLKFIFSLSSASAKLEKAWMDAHIAAGNAIFPHWTNQTAVLEHPASCFLYFRLTKVLMNLALGDTLFPISWRMEFVYRGARPWGSNDLLAIYGESRSVETCTGLTLPQVDQPVNSMQIAEIHDCGFELLQIRTGPAKSKAYQNGTEIEIAGTDDAVRGEMKQILDMSKGARGEQQRMNTRRLGRTIRDSLSPGGSGDLALEDFGAVLGLAH